jgi:hypothetical protein
MGEELQHEVTQILHDWSGGDPQALVRVTGASLLDLKETPKREIANQAHFLT